jgi:hypothetical protein
MISRRDVLKSSLGLAAAFLLGPVRRAEGTTNPQFFISQIRYRGGEWDPNPQFAEAIVEELETRTSIPAAGQRRIVTIPDPGLFFCPFLYIAGTATFDQWSAQERDIVRRYLTLGGFLLAEDTLGAKGAGFDASFRREMKQIFPNRDLTRLPPDHSIFQSFYLINSVAGRLRTSASLDGIMIDNWTPVIYSQNDLAGAWARDKSGRWLNDCIPGGELQRRSAFKLGINIIVYSLTGDYKKDLIHHPFIKKRQAS